MRVTIEHTTTKVGMFKSTAALKVAIEFNELEKEAIKRSGLNDYTVFKPTLTRHEPERMQHAAITVKMLVDAGERGMTMAHDDLAAARADEARLREALKTFKAAIDNNSTPVKQSDTFEL